MDCARVAAMKRVVADAALSGKPTPRRRRVALQLARTDETQARIARMAAGEPPWGA
jgi:hypothetical protein